MNLSLKSQLMIKQYQDEAANLHPSYEPKPCVLFIERRTLNLEQTQLIKQHRDEAAELRPGCASNP